MNKNNLMFPLHFSNSSLAVALSCETKFFWKYIANLSGESRSNDLDAGSFYALGLEIARKLYYREGVPALEAQKTGIESAIEDFSKVLLSSSAKKTPAIVKNALELYFKNFPLAEEEYLPVTFDSGPAIEIIFDLEFPAKHPITGDSLLHPEFNIPLRYKGKLDQLVTYLGSPAIYDDKTTGGFSRIDGEIDLKSLTESFSTSGQFISYAWAANQITGLSVKHAIVRSAGLLKTPEVVEITMPVTQYQIDIWYNSALDKIASLIKKYKYLRSNLDEKALSANALARLPAYVFSPNLQTSCNEYFKRCPFSAGCISEKGGQILNSNFVSVIYDPVSKETYSVSDYRKVIGLDEGELDEVKFKL